MIARSEAVEIVESWQWTCSDCGKTGLSKSRHAARRRLNAHWRTCPR